MADNVTIPTTGSGTATPVIATDDVGSVHYQKIKLDGGGDGASIPLIAGQQTMAASLPVVVASNQAAIPVAGDIAHDAADSGNPVKGGAKAADFGVTQTAVAANDRTNLFSDRSGVAFVLGGHPDTVTLEAAYTAAQTDTALVASVAANFAVVVTQIQAVCDEANTVGVGIRVGFGAANTPTTTGVVLTHPGLVPGSGLSRGDGSGVIGVGASGEELRVTCEVPTGGSIRVLVSYFLIAIG